MSDEANYATEEVKKLRRSEGRRKKRMRERGSSSSKTDDEPLSENEQHDHGCPMCNTKLADIQDKLDKMLSFLPEIQSLKKRVTELEKEKEALEASLELTQAEVEKLKNEASATDTKLTEASKKIAKIDELERRVIKQECFNRRNNIKFFGIDDTGQESPETTEKVLRSFLSKEMKMPNRALQGIEFERVHRIPTRPNEGNQQQPRPIIAKVSFFKDKELIKSHIKYLPKGKKLGIADDFPKEIDAIRKKLYPVMKKAKKDQKTAFFNVDKLIIDKIVYHGPETKEMPLYGRIMEST